MVLHTAFGAQESSSILTFPTLPNAREEYIEKTLFSFFVGKFIESGNAMRVGLLFWILMILWLIFGFIAYWPSVGAAYWGVGGHALLWVLLALLGYKTFGPPLVD